MIYTDGAKPVKHFPVSPAIEKFIYDELERIEESSSSWSFPVFLHKKPGENRLC